MDKQQVRERILAMLCAEHCCDADAFVRGELVVTELASDRQRDRLHRSWPPVPKSQWRAASIGQGGVVSATADWIAQARTAWEGKRRALDESSVHAMFQLAGEQGRKYFYGPKPWYTCGTEDLLPVDRHLAVDLIEGRTDKMDAARWPNAYVPESATVMFTALCMQGKELVALGTAVPLAPSLVEISLDVLPSAQRRGLGTAVTYALSRKLLDVEHVPLYTTSMTNVASIRTAQRAGLWLAFTEAATF